MTKIPLETQKMTKIPRNLKNDPNTPETQKMTKVSPKPKE